MQSRHKQSGAVSIFIVVFTALLISIITVGFVRIMLRDQQQATASDLSQSAYDSALAGVEDGKRLISQYYDGTLASIPANSCLVGPGSGQLGGDGSEVIVGDPALNQAYTCVKINLNTEDYIGSLAADEVNLIPLKATANFNRVVIEWFSQDDLSSGVTEFTIPSGASVGLPAQNDWGVSTPPLLEAQLITYRSDFTLDDFDSNGGDADTRSLSLYPANLASAGGSSVSFGDNSRRSPTNNGLERIKCVPSTAESGWGSNYACRAEIATVPTTINTSMTAYLRLTPRYNAAHYRITLLQGNTPRLFNGVQPSIDSTGRASDLFRRVKTRVEPGSSALYPSAAVDVSGNFCKTFSVTTRTTDYRPGSCTP